MENFDIMAKDFDTNERIERARVISDKILTHITEGNKISAIEYGCGTGLVGLQIAEKFEKLLLIDSSSEMIKQVERKLENLNNPAVSALCCDLMENTVEIPSADYIFSSLVLHHIKDTETVLHRLYNKLNEGGHLLIIDLDEEDGNFHAKYPDFDGHNGFNHNKLITSSLKVGFTKVNVETFYHGSKVHEEKENQYSLFILDATR